MIPLGWQYIGPNMVVFFATTEVLNLTQFFEFRFCVWRRSIVATRTVIAACWPRTSVFVSPHDGTHRSIAMSPKHTGGDKQAQPRGRR